MNWEKLTTVLLDMDGTLLDLYFDNYFWHEHVPLRYSQKHSVDLEYAKQELNARYQRKAGTLDWYCTDYWANDLNLDIYAFKQEVSHRISVFPNVKKFLERLLQSDMHVVLATNAHRDSISVKMNTAKLERYFNNIISSHDFGYSKEQQLFWRRLMEIEPFDPSSTLFIDDNLKVLAAAEEFGIKHLVTIKQPDSTKAEQDTLHYHAISDFSQIMPVIPVSSA